MLARSRSESTDRAPNQRRRNCEPGHRRFGAESSRESVHRPIDNTAVETEEEPANRRHRRQPDDIEVIVDVVVLLDCSYSVSRGIAPVWLCCHSC